MTLNNSSLNNNLYKKYLNNRYMVCDLLLISPFSRAHNRRPPLSLLSLATFLNSKGINTEIIDEKITSYLPPTQKQHNLLIKRAIMKTESYSPIALGFTCFSHEVEEIIKLAEVFKKKFPQIRIIVGGVHATVKPLDFIYRGSPVDFAVRGEGEMTLYELVSFLKTGRSNFSYIDGLVYLQSKAYFTKPRKLIENLDDIPIIDYSKIDMDFYTKPNIYAIRWILLSNMFIFTSRGCPSQCKFCANKNLWKTTSSKCLVRFRSIQSVIREIKILRNKYNIDSIYIYDDNFIIKKERVIEFCDEMINQKIGILWGCSARVNLITEGLLIKMKKAGCIQIDFGVESGSEKSLQIVKKNINLSQVRKAFRLCRKHNIRALANFMFNFPDEDKEDVKKTIHLVKQIRPDVSNFAILTPFPGTDIYEERSIDFKKKDYTILMDSIDLVRDKRMRFAKHDIDLAKLVADCTRRFNSIFYVFNLSILAKYFLHLAKSRRKKEYFIYGLTTINYYLTNRIPRLLKGKLSPTEKN
ncbi:radical SAM protein [Candidatus Woesearchaeota archaeon]|nr:radical SAM protein [Candidatus Woesearchaeota archaeon]